MLHLSSLALKRWAAGAALCAAAALPALTPTAAHAWWRGPAVVVAAPPVVYAPPPPVVYAPPPRYVPRPYARWVPGHYNRFGRWIPPHRV
ncbi:MAG: hypothetical protein JO157_02870 [Acetobacteraceae bacterium]|nr:hypothetical protein [Acetobacteraceae bacterium]